MRWEYLQHDGEVTSRFMPSWRFRKGAHDGHDAAVHGVIRCVAARLFRDGELVSGDVTPPCPSSTIAEGSRASILRAPQLSPRHAVMHGDPGAESPVPSARRPSAGGRRQSCRHFLTCVSNHAHETGRVLELDPGTPPRAVIFSGILGCLGEWTNASASRTPQHPYKYHARPRPVRLLFSR